MEKPKTLDYLVCTEKNCFFKMCLSCYKHYGCEKPINIIIQDQERNENKSLFITATAGATQNLFSMNTQEDTLIWGRVAIGFLEKKTIPNLFSKIVPIDERFFFVIGGSPNLNLQDKTMKEPPCSIFLIDQPRLKIYPLGKMNPYRNHAACVYSKTEGLIYVIGGEFKGNWVDSCSTISIKTEELTQANIPEIPKALFGPSATIGIINGIQTILAAGADLAEKVTRIYKFSKSSAQWDEF